MHLTLQNCTHAFEGELLQLELARDHFCNSKRVETRVELDRRSALVCKHNSPPAIYGRPSITSCFTYLATASNLMSLIILSFRHSRYIDSTNFR